MTATRPPSPALARKVVDRGYRALKVDPFGAATAELSHAQLELSTDIVAAIRAEVGPEIGLMIEMHGRFTAATAVAGGRGRWSRTVQSG